MTKQIEAMKLALEALEWDSDYDKRQTARAALREALAEQPAQQGPVDLVDGEGNPLTLMQAIDHAIPLYTSPPAQRTWVGLNDTDLAVCGDQDDVLLARYWERVCREKNT